MAKTTRFWWVTYLPGDDTDAIAVGQKDTLEQAQVDCRLFAKTIKGLNAEHRIYRDANGESFHWRATGPRARNWKRVFGRPV